MRNSSDKPLPARLEVRGLWGTRFRVGEETVEAEGGAFRATVEVAAESARTVTIEVLA